MNAAYQPVDDAERLSFDVIYDIFTPCQIVMFAQGFRLVGRMFLVLYY